MLKAKNAAESFVIKIEDSISPRSLSKFSIFNPTVHQGIIASGDKFIANPDEHEDLSFESEGKKTLAVEMEGASIAQVCDEHDIPYIVIRTISDKADHSAEIDFQAFVGEIASQYSAGIIREYFQPDL